jgi:hypothetical protein
MLKVVMSTRIAKRNVQMGSASFQSGFLGKIKSELVEYVDLSGSMLRQNEIALGLRDPA